MATKSTESSENDINERLRALWRRRRTVLLGFAIGMTLTVLLAVLLPSRFMSAATILIEQQEIPADLVRSMITSFADQRVQVISQRVMTTQNLLGIIERYDLYPDIRKAKPREVLLERMRSDVGMQLISADVIDPRSGVPTKATIAFTVSYSSGNPDLAYKVANELTSLYLSENVNSRTRSADQATTFLEEQSARLSTEIKGLEGALATFKQKHADRLPDLSVMNLQVMDRTDQELRDTNNQLISLDQQKALVGAQLAQLNPTASLSLDGSQRVLTPAERLKALKSTLASLSARYSPEHPDVLSVKREIEGLEQQTSADADGNELVRQLEDAKSKLGAAQQRYTADHPDVKRLARLVAGLEASIASEAAGNPKPFTKSDPDNPAYIQVKGQLDSLLAQRAALERKSNELSTKRDNYERRMSQAPEVEREYRALARDYDNARLKYQEVRAKQMEAQVAKNLETERKGEKFTIIEPPLPPEEPVSPRRGLILIAGFLLSVALALGAVLGLEMLRGTVRGPEDLRRLLEVPALAAVPVIVTSREQVRRREFLRTTWAAGAVTLAATGLLVHLLVRPLDLVWLSVLRRFGG